ncbi:MAG: virginiamycin B lyase family protein [Acidimicrobiia bacterium]
MSRVKSSTLAVVAFAMLSAMFVGVVPASSATELGDPLGTNTTFAAPSVMTPDYIRGDVNLVAVGTDGTVWIYGTSDGLTGLGELTPADGDFTMFPNAAISSNLAAGPAGNMWAIQSTSSIGRITPAGVVTNFTDPLINAPDKLVAGADGNMWFINTGDHSIGRIAPNGAVTRFTDPTITSPLGGLVVGSNGNMWFINAGDASVIRVAPNGSIARFTDPAISSPQQLVAASDGSIWFINSSDPAIGRIATDGAATLFTDPELHGITKLTAGTNGGMWFTKQFTPPDDTTSGCCIAAGLVTAEGLTNVFYDKPLAGGDPYTWVNDLAADQYGNVWISERHLKDDSVEQVSPTGLFRGWANGGGTIIAGPDGNIWTNTNVGSTYDAVLAILRIGTVPAPVSIGTASLPDGRAGLAYSASLAVPRLSGIDPYSWDITSGSLPPGLALSSSGAITGTPTKSGTFTFTAHVTDSRSPAGTATKSLSITIDPYPVFRITTTQLPAATLGQPYVATVIAATGIPPYKWKRIGSLPRGLKLDPKSGTIIGIPKRATGTFTFTVQAKYKTKLAKQKPVWHYATRALSITVS